MAHESLFRRRPAGPLTTISAAFSAGALCGSLFGTLDAILAAVHGTAHLTIFSFLGCLAASVLHYALLFMLALALLGVLLHPLLRSRARDLSRRYVLFVFLGAALGAFAEIFWWSRPYVFYGHPVLSVERLLSSVGLALVAAGIGILVARGAMRLSDVASRAVALYCGVCCCVGALYVWIDSGSATRRGVVDERTKDQPNVLLVVVDALRQDTLGCYGDARVQTPNLDKLAAEGVLFENHRTQVPFTWPSFGSLLTGKYPRRHGLVKMAPGYRMPFNLTLPAELKCGTRADGREMQDQDWLAATFHTGTLSTGSGLLRGFDQYFEAMAGHELVTLDSTWSAFRSDLLLFVFRNKITQRFDNAIVASSAREWIAQHAHQRFMTMVHLYSTHTPYDPPQWARELYCDKNYTGPVKAFYAESRIAMERGKYQPTPADIQQIRDLYYGGVSQADALIGSLVEELRAQGVLDDTLVIVTSDHGESLGEEQGDGRLWEHDHMVETNLRIPLVMRWPAALKAGTRVAARTDEIDVFPTVVELAHLAPPPQAEVNDIVDGKSLLPLVRGDLKTQRTYSFAENALFASVCDDRWKLIVDVADARGEKGQYAPKLFDLQADPGEKRELAASQPQEVDRLLGEVQKWSKEMPVREMEKSARDLDQQSLLEHLGYTGKEHEAK
ncbi:MAG: sulfatase [Planctomycetes bacterium]|nr:sulfatase [Planctomycetota bacterium]